MSENSTELIIKLLREKTALEQKIANNTTAAFELVKTALQGLVTDISGGLDQASKSEMGFLAKKAAEKPPATEVKENSPLDIVVPAPAFSEKGESEIQFDIGSDTIMYVMDTHAFSFDTDHAMWKTSYVQLQKSLSFCGTIYVYNFLADSFKYERNNDVGYLIARIFVNAENHYFVEGKRQLGFLYNDFAHAVMTPEAMRKVIESTVLYSLDFDPFNPPYENVNQVTVKEILNTSQRAKIATGKRLGFRFSADSDAM